LLEFQIKNRLPPFLSETEIIRILRGSRDARVEHSSGGREKQPHKKKRAGNKQAIHFMERPAAVLALRAHSFRASRS
jgi:hypothetical protein